MARDETGKCINPEDTKRDEELKSKINFSEAQDPRLLAEIKVSRSYIRNMYR